MKTLVTGGTGFIGSHLVQALLAAGHEVRCLVRSRQRLRWLHGLEVELVEGDCRDRAALGRAVAGTDRVFHAAGVTWAVRPEEYFLHNARATLSLIEACLRHAPSLQRFVLVSSQAAAGPAIDRRPTAESDIPRPITPYGASKLAAEYHVLRFADRLPSVIIRPSAVYGPRDRAFLPYFRLARRGFLIEFVKGERIVSLCHVRDAVTGLLTAADSQVGSGSVYFIADPEPYCWRDVEQLVREAVNVAARRVVVPAWCLSMGAAIGQLYGKVTGRNTMLNRARSAELLEPCWSCDASRARRELDFKTMISLRDGLHEAVRWYEEQNWL